jgi:hypothetical protein
VYNDILYTRVSYDKETLNAFIFYFCPSVSLTLSLSLSLSLSRSWSIIVLRPIATSWPAITLTNVNKLIGRVRVHQILCAVHLTVRTRRQGQTV